MSCLGDAKIRVEQDKAWLAPLRTRADAERMVYEKTTEELVKHATRNIRAETKGKMGIVRCNNYRCLAVQGKDGKWRDAQGTELQVVEVVTVF